MVLVEVGTLVATKSSAVAAYSLISYMQTMLLATAIGIYMPSDVSNTKEAMGFFIMNFNFLPGAVSFTENINSARNLGTEFLSTYSILGLKHDSAFDNLGKLIFVFIALFILYLIIVLNMLFIQFTCKKSRLHKLTKAIFDIFTWSLFIRLFLISYFYVLL